MNKTAQIEEKQSKVLKNKQIIKDYLQEMLDQNNRSTAHPYFFVIRTEV